MIPLTLVTLLASILVIVISLVSILLLTPLTIRILKSRGFLVQDFHKPSKPLVPKPGGPAIIISLIIGESAVYLFTGNIGILALILVTAISGVIGLLDDAYTLSGVMKPVSLLIASLPILLLGTFSSHPEFPIFGAVRLTLIYPLLVLIAIPVTANTVNTIDVLNGVVSGFITIAAIPIMFALALKGNTDMFLAALPIFTVSFGFYIFHKFPSRIFPGDSGSLSLGAIYGAIAIVGGVEIIGIIAILPAILNSFFFLSSVKRLVEHRKLKERPTIVLGENRLAASRSVSAPLTLVRLILADGPLTEKEITLNILKLTIYSAFLAIITASMTWLK